MRKLIFTALLFISTFTYCQKTIEINWMGTLNNKIPINLKYSLSDKIIIGEIIYLNTKNKIPIKVIGTIEEDKSYRILEFEPNGNISGTITGKPNDKEFNGEWYSPKSGKTLILKLKNPVSTIKNKIEKVDFNGEYHYSYGDLGSYGDFDIGITKNKCSFNIFSVSGAPSRSIADIGGEDVEFIENKFKYKSEEEDCQFQVSFYPNFAIIEYIDNHYNCEFGHNATIEGIYLKIK